jgi:hypothetical protein
LANKHVLTQVEVVVNRVTGDEDETEEMEEGGDGGIVTVNVTGLVATPGTRGLGRSRSSLGQVL